MIYVTAGNQRFPFTRLLLSVNSAIQEGIITDNVYVQYGSFRPEFKLDQFTEKRPAYPYEEHIDMIRHADMIVSHAGEDIVLLALMLGKFPIIMPRQKNFGEHIDNHQVEFSAKMHDLNKAIAVYQADQLIHTMCHYYDILNNLTNRFEQDPLFPKSSDLTTEIDLLLQSCMGNSNSVNEKWEMV